MQTFRMLFLIYFWHINHMNTKILFYSHFHGYCEYVAYNISPASYIIRICNPISANIKIILLF